MFNTLNWKREKPLSYEASLRDYKNYPPRMATHTEEVTFLRCARCNKCYNTDARQPAGGGRDKWFYKPVTDYITYQRNLDAYYCVTPCK